jgi:transposase-like protein
MPNLTDKIFHDDDEARAHLEAIRWPNGPICPHCGNADGETIKRLEGKSHRKGLFQCNACREHFTVTVGGVMERSHIPLCKWVLAFHLMAASKKGVSAHQLMRTLGLGSYRTAWFMAHRIREAMKTDVATSGPIGGEGKTVEADETYIGKRETPRKLSRGRIAKPTKSGKSGGAQKRVVFGLVERGGRAKMFLVQDANAEAIRDVLVRNADRASALHTDESRLYLETGKEFADHRSVKHSAKEYVRYEADAVVHSNTIENVFSVFKRGMAGIYQHCGEAHLPRYLTEFEFRYNNRSALGVEDNERTAKAIKGAEGRRLMYAQPREAKNA